MECIGEDGTLFLRETRIAEAVVEGYTYFRNGDVLVAKITSCFENGKGALCEGLVNGAGFGTTELHVLRATEAITPRFLFYLTRTHIFRSFGAGTMKGAAGQARVPEEFVANLRVALPPLDEQCAIVAHIDRETARIDALVAKRERLIALLGEKRAALIAHAVTRGLNPTASRRDAAMFWLSEIPAHWERSRFRFCVRIKEGMVDPTDRIYRELPLIAPDHIEKGTGRLLGLESTYAARTCIP